MRAFFAIFVSLLFSFNSYADYLIQAPDSATNLEYELNHYLDTHHPYSEINERIYVLNFSTGKLAAFQVTQVNPWEPWRTVYEVPTTASQKLAAQNAQQAYLAAKGLPDLPEIPGSVVSDAYSFVIFSAQQNRLETYLQTSGILLGVQERIEQAITFAETGIVTVREVLMERSVKLADGGIVIVQLVKTHRNDFKYVIVKVMDKMGNTVPLTINVSGSAIGFEINQDAQTFNSVVNLLTLAGYNIVVNPHLNVPASGTVKVKQIVCDASGECRIYEV